MSRFPDHFLDQLRSSIPVSDVVQKWGIKLRKKGHGEWEQVDNTSFTVSDQKGIWHDFGSKAGKRTGDAIDFELELGGGTFHEAVERLARSAGIPLPPGTGPTKDRQHGARPAAANGAGDHASNGAHGPADADLAAGRGDEPRKIVAIYDYEDADGVLKYQTCRVEWTDGGKRKKSFRQRRPLDGREGFAWGLKAGQYVQARDGDWLILTEDREHWSGDRITLDDVAHGLYRFPQLREEMAQDPEDRRTVFIPEGERKVDVHTEWGIVATCSSGGAANWQPHHAQEFLGADVVIEADNDKAGREGAEKKAASLRGLASRVRVLHWGEVWPECPVKGDIVDFKNAGRGTAEFWKIIEGLKDWTPSLPESTHGAIRFADLDKPGKELQWLVKRVLTRGEVSIWYGPYGCGKSFLITDMAFAVDRGINWMGQRVRRGLVIYQAGEGGLGFKLRMRAYRKMHGIDAVKESSFVLWPQRINLYRDDVDMTKMIDEMKQWASYYDLPLELVIIDTVSAAIPGANENASEDMGQVLERARTISKETGAHVALVHHVPKAGGSPRGWSGLGGNVETLVEVMRSESGQHREVEDGKTHIRDLRQMVVRKQKDGADGFTRDFVLKQVVVGKDEDMEDVTSCAVMEVNGEQPHQAAGSIPTGWALLNPTNTFLMSGLVKALKDKGAYPPKDKAVAIPEMTVAVKVGDWISSVCEMYFSNDPGDPPTEKYPYGAKLFARAKKAIERCYAQNEWSSKLNLIGKDREWIWRTTRKVAGIDEPPRPVASRQQPMALAPGETEEGVRDFLAD